MSEARKDTSWVYDFPHLLSSLFATLLGNKYGIRARRWNNGRRYGVSVDIVSPRQFTENEVAEIKDIARRISYLLGVPPIIEVSRMRVYVTVRYALGRAQPRRGDADA